MSRHRGTWVALGSFLLLVGALLVWQVHTARTSKAELAAVASRRAQILLEARNLRASIARWRRDEVAALESPILRSAADSPSPGGDTPEQRQKRLRILRAWMALENSALYRRLGLTPEQISRWEDLEVSHYLRLQDIAATAQAEKLPFSDPVIVKLGKEEIQEFQQEQTAALGVPLTQQIQEYTRTTPARIMADAVAGNIFYTEEPLSADQADQLTQILANNSVAYQKGQTANPKDIDFTAAVAQLQKVLSPIQLAALTNLYQSDQAGTKLGQLLAIQGAAAPAPAATPPK